MIRDTIYKENKYGIVKDKYGNVRIGRYNFRYQSGRYFLDMRGITTKKGGFESLSYCQWLEDMLISDYPFEISEDIFNKINSIIRCNITEIENILSLQPEVEMPHQLNSKFFTKTDRFYDVHNIKLIGDTGCEFYDGVRIGVNDILELKYYSTPPFWTSNEDTCFYLSDSVYDYIKGKALQISVLLKSICASIYNSSALDVPL